MRIISAKHLILGIGIGLLSLFSGLSAQAQNIELKVYSENDNKQSCPNKVIASEVSQPYREGSFATDGTANLSAIATNLSITASNNFSVTWVGTLKPSYAKCLASGGITKLGNENYSGHSNYLRVHFSKGKVYLLLDLAGEYDPNDYPLVVLKKGIKNGNPTWTWGGTD